MKTRPAPSVSIGGIELQSGRLNLPTASAAGRQAKEQRDAMLALATSMSGLIKHQYPGLAAPVAGVELIVTTSMAFEASADPDRTDLVKPTLNTVRAVAEAVDLLLPWVPVLQPYSGSIKTVVLIAKAGDSAWQVRLAYRSPRDPRHSG